MDPQKKKNGTTVVKKPNNEAFQQWSWSPATGAVVPAHTAIQLNLCWVFFGFFFRTASAVARLLLAAAGHMLVQKVQQHKACLQRNILFFCVAMLGVTSWLETRTWHTYISHPGLQNKTVASQEEMLSLYRLHGKTIHNKCYDGKKQVGPKLKTNVCWEKWTDYQT